jgi:hypothetical protein
MSVCDAAMTLLLMLLLSSALRDASKHISHPKTPPMPLPPLPLPLLLLLLLLLCTAVASTTAPDAAHSPQASVMPPST